MHIAFHYLILSLAIHVREQSPRLFIFAALSARNSARSVSEAFHVRCRMLKALHPL
jgi:hypothetical protein